MADNTQEITGGEKQLPHTCSSYVPLNLTQVTAGQLRSLGTSLGIPASGTVSNLKLMIEGKITEGSCDPRNIQVLLPKDTEDSCISLRDHEGFLMVTIESDMELHRDSELPSNLLHLLDPIKDTTVELQAIRVERCINGGGAYLIREGCILRAGRHCQTRSRSQ